MRFIGTANQDVVPQPLQVWSAIQAARRAYGQGTLTVTFHLTPVALLQTPEPYFKFSFSSQYQPSYSGWESCQHFQKTFMTRMWCLIMGELFHIHGVALWEFHRHISPRCVSAVNNIKGSSNTTGKQTRLITFKKCCFVFGLHEMRRERRHFNFWKASLSWCINAWIPPKVSPNFFQCLIKGWKEGTWTSPSVSIFIRFPSVFGIISSDSLPSSTFWSDFCHKSIL